MLNYKLARLVFVLLISVLVILNVVWLYIPWYAYALSVLAFFGMISYGSYQIQSGFFLKAICSGSKEAKKIALTFDDGPDEQVTPALIELLIDRNVPASFFVIGNKVEQHPVLVRQLDNNGFIVGNHSYSHSNGIGFFSKKKLRKEYDTTDEIIFKTIGKTPKYLRPPFGVTNPSYGKLAKEKDYTVIGWSNRSMDTVTPKADVIFNRVKKQLKSGDIILFHDTDIKIISVISQLLDYLQETGFQVVSLDELTNTKAYV